MHRLLVQATIDDPQFKLLAAKTPGLHLAAELVAGHAREASRTSAEQGACFERAYPIAGLHALRCRAQQTIQHE